MRKIALLVLVAFLSFACNSSEKPSADDVKKEINVENLVEVTIPVHGMTCEGCQNAIKNSIGTLEGIAEVSASYIDSVAVVKYDKTLASLGDIEGKIADAGYAVRK